MDINTGGPAFPHCDIYQYSSEGMTLRDYFAAKAMQGMISTAGAPCLSGVDGIEELMGLAAYKIADAMLKARE